MDETRNPTALFTGDTLFIGDVGRPDLAQAATGITKEQMAGILFNSLVHKILPLPDDIMLYPAHGAGSACGKNMSKETTDTLGHQKATNYALRPGMTEDEFIKESTEGLTPPPAYFPLNVLLNKTGYEPFDKVIKRGDRALSPDAFERTANTAGTLIPDIEQKILIVADAGREEEVITRLARVGLDHPIGYLKGGFAAWKAAGKETDSIPSLSAAELATKQGKTAPVLLDVRRNSEYQGEHIIGSINTPLDTINDTLPQIDRSRTSYVFCAGGYRSMIFISTLKARGYDKLVNIRGGFKAIKERGLFPLTEYVCPTTLL